MKAKRILNIFAILITSSILVSLLCSCFDSENKYLKSVGYYCENEEFKSVYFEFYSDKIEILSHGALSPKLTIKDFYKGKSEPTNKKLSDILFNCMLVRERDEG